MHGGLEGAQTRTRGQQPQLQQQASGRNSAMRPGVSTHCCSRASAAVLQLCFAVGSWEQLAGCGPASSRCRLCGLGCCSKGTRPCLRRRQGHRLHAAVAAKWLDTGQMRCKSTPCVNTCACCLLAIGGRSWQTVQLCSTQNQQGVKWVGTALCVLHSSDSISL